MLVAVRRRPGVALARDPEEGGREEEATLLQGPLMAAPGGSSATASTGPTAAPCVLPTRALASMRSTTGSPRQAPATVAESSFQKLSTACRDSAPPRPDGAWATTMAQRRKPAVQRTSRSLGPL